MKKQLAIIFFLALVISLSSCELFECKHKEYSEKVVAPTCTENGYTEHTCSSCGDTYNDTYTEKTKHYFAGEACPNCGMEEITENITPDTEWYSEWTAMYTLTTKEELAGLASLVNSGTNFSGRIIYLGADIDLGYYEWIPIGNAEHAFNGKFDADGHTISGLKINASADYVGLFGNSCGQIMYLNVEDANIFSAREYNYISIICGYTTNEIKEVSASGFINAKKSQFVGGIIGAAAKDSVTYTIYNAKACVDIIGSAYIGAIVGKADNIPVSTCSNEGSKVASNPYLTGVNAYLGGYVGYGYSIDNCVNNLDITYNAQGQYIGGIIGYATGGVSNCTNNGTIITYTNFVGGIAGMVYHQVTFSSQNNLTNTAYIQGKDYVGGIVGRMYISSSNWENTMQMEKLFNLANIKGEKYVGGLMGDASASNNYGGSSAHHIYFKELENIAHISGISYCGELFGHFNSDGNSTVADYIVTGKITVDGKWLEGTYDVGSKNNLTLSGREIYTEETPEENTEASE